MNNKAVVDGVVQPKLRRSIFMKNILKVKAIHKVAGIIALVAVIGFSMAACGGGDDDNGGIPSELVGKWYKAGSLIFEITSNGVFNDKVNNYSYDVSVSGKTVELKMDGTTAGSFDYSISNGEMTITKGTGVGMAYMTLSPLVDSGDDDGGGIPSELVGKWYKAGSLIFEITSNGVFNDKVNNYSYDVSVSGKTVELKMDGTIAGSFDYSINNIGEMTITKGAGVGMAYMTLSPLDDGGGRLTVTNIPSEYNGKYAGFSGDNEILDGYHSLNKATGVFTLVQIANGFVILPMWIYNAASGERIRYSGNHDVYGYFFIQNSATVTPSGEQSIAGREYAISFNNGNATVSWFEPIK